ncbi:hypothetical protein ACFXTH_011792 [Malus domestica]
MFMYKVGKFHLGSESKNPGSPKFHLKIFAGEWGAVDKLTGGSDLSSSNSTMFFDLQKRFTVFAFLFVDSAYD